MPIIVGIEPWAASPEYFEQMEKGIRLAAQDVINRAMAKLNIIEDKTLKMSTEIIEGPPRQVIVDEAETWRADLIVMADEIES